MSETTTPVIEATALSRRFGDLTAVDAVDLTIRRGEIVAILGPNGAGKTTLIEMLLGLRMPSGGTVRVFGLDPSGHEARSRVGAMLQDTDAPTALSVSEIVTLVRHYYPKALPVDTVLAAAGLLEHRRKRVAQLSGGLRQRLSFAVAMCGDPELLYLDEPTAALDVEARLAFWAQVRGFASSGRTVLFSTHNLAEAQSLAHRVVVIVHGRIVADGTPREIASRVGGSVVELTTDTVPEWLENATIRHTGQGTVVIRVVTAEPETFLRRMFDGGHAVTDLHVTPADLEDAFVDLISAR